MLTRYTPSSVEPIELQQQLLDRDQILQQLKRNLQRAQQTMKVQADKRRTDISFEVGDQVLVKLQPYRQNSTALRNNHKLGMRYFGPFSIIEKVRKVAYKLQLPETARIHSVFHISQLKQFKGSTTEPYLPLPLTTVEQGPILSPEKTLQKHCIMQGNQQVQQVLVKWQHVPAKEATWENAVEFTVNYLDLNLEDKIAFEGEGNVMNDDVEDMSQEVSGTFGDQARRVSKRDRKEHSRWDQFVSR